VPGDPELQTAEQGPKATVDVAAPTGSHAGHTDCEALDSSAWQIGPVVFVHKSLWQDLNGLK
jgi:hypothetical protein